MVPHGPAKGSRSPGVRHDTVSSLGFGRAEGSAGSATDVRPWRSANSSSASPCLVSLPIGEGVVEHLGQPFCGLAAVLDGRRPGAVGGGADIGGAVADLGDDDVVLA